MTQDKPPGRPRCIRTSRLGRSELWRKPPLEIASNSSHNSQKRSNKWNKSSYGSIMFNLLMVQFPDVPLMSPPTSWLKWAPEMKFRSTAVYHFMPAWHVGWWASSSQHGEIDKQLMWLNGSISIIRLSTAQMLNYGSTSSSHVQIS